MNVSDLIDPSFSYRLITTLMHFLWQGSLVAVLAVLGDTLLSRASASRRYTLHVAALTIMIACVAVTFSKVASPISAPLVSAKLAPVVPTTERIVQGPKDLDSTERPSTLTPAIAGVETPLPELPAAAGTNEMAEPLVGQDRPFGDGDRWQQLQHYAPHIAVLYFVCCGMLLARLVRGTWVAHRMRRLATAVSEDSLIAIVQRQAKELGLRVMPSVAWCAEVSIPLVIGIFKPVILLPVAAGTGLSLEQLQALITHELAHIRRYDLLVNLVQRIVESMLFFHPAVWYISRRISSEREQACDELVLATGCERLRYADALVRMAELSSSLRGLRTCPATSLAASGASPSEFKRRVLKVLSAPTTSDPQPSRIALLVIMALIVGVTVSGSRLQFKVLAESPSKPTPTAVMPPKGLEFLTSYPKLQGLSLDMTEPQFLKIVKQQELKTRKTGDGSRFTHHIGLGDGHSLVVMFDKDGKCMGIQRVAPEIVRFSNKDRNAVSVQTGDDVHFMLYSHERLQTGLSKTVLDTGEWRIEGLVSLLKDGREVRRFSVKYTSQEPETLYLDGQALVMDRLPKPDNTDGGRMPGRLFFLRGEGETVQTGCTGPLKAESDLDPQRKWSLAYYVEQNLTQENNSRAGRKLFEMEGWVIASDSQDRIQHGSGARSAHVRVFPDGRVVTLMRDGKTLVESHVPRNEVAAFVNWAIDVGGAGQRKQSAQVMYRGKLVPFFVDPLPPALWDQHGSRIAINRDGKTYDLLSIEPLRPDRPEPVSLPKTAGELTDEAQSRLQKLIAFAVADNSDTTAKQLANPKNGEALPGRLFVNAGLRTTKDETRISQSAIAVDPNTGKWTQLRSLNASGLTVPLSPVRVSPDGRTMLFMQKNETWKCDAATGEQAKRVLEKGSPAAWAPDGKTFIAVVPKNEKDAQDIENWIVNLDGQKQSVLQLTKGDEVEDWSADGQWLAVRSRYGRGIFLVKPDGSGRRHLADAGSVGYSMGRTGFSPDSQHIVYLREQEFDGQSRHSLRIINIDGTGDREILGETKAASNPNSANRTAPMAARWSPDGKQLAVVLFDHADDGGITAIGGNWRLALIDPDGGNLRELKLDGLLTTVLPWDGPEWSRISPAKLPEAPEKQHKKQTENSGRDAPHGAVPDSDLLAKYGDQLAVSWVRHGDSRSPDRVFLIAVLTDGTVIAGGDSNRNRECQIKLAAAQLDQLLKEMDEVDHCFDLVPDGEQVIQPGQPYNSWDHDADWLRIRRGKKELQVGLVGGWIVGQDEHTPGVSTCRKVMARLYPLINVTRAGGWDEIERLLPIANAALKQAFPELPPLTAKDFSSSERFQYPARSIYFRRTGADGEKFGVELERRDDGTVNPISVWNGGDIRDVEKPLVVRGLDLAKIPFTKEWKEMEKLRVLTGAGYSFKPEYAAYEVAPETWACHLPKEDKFYIEVGNNQRRRRLYGPIAGSPLKVLNPPPVPEKTDNAAAADGRQRDLSLADSVHVFNDENQHLSQALNQPALTEEEVIAVLKRDKWQQQDPPLNEQEITAFKAVAESKRLPEFAHLHLETADETETFVWKKLWRVRLMLPAIGREGHVGLTIRDTKVAEEKIDSKQVAWGKPDAEGLTLGIYLSPRKAQYAIGDRVRLRFLVRNNGQQPVKTMWPGMSVPMPDAFTVTDQTGAQVAVNIGHKNWDSPWTTLSKHEMLGVGDVHGLTVPYEISIGGDGSKNSLIGRVINARPGQKLQFKVRERNGSTRMEGEAVSESGSISFTVAEGPVDPNAGLHKSDE